MDAAAPTIISRLEALDGWLLMIICLYSGLAVTGLLGNMWVMLTVSSQLAGCAFPSSHRGGTLKHTVQSSAYIYLLLLSIVDLISFVSVPLLVTDILENKWPFSKTLCKMLFFCEGMNKTLSPLVLTALSIDRYIAVCQPTLLWMRQTKFALVTIIGCVMISLFFITPVTMEANILRMQDQKGDEVDKCTINIPLGDTFDLIHALCCYFIPLVLICSVYVAILRKLYRHTRMSTVGRKTSISLSRVVRCSVMVVAFYFICWTPYWTMRFFEFIQPASYMDEEVFDLPPTDRSLPLVLNLTTAPATPIIAAISSGNGTDSASAGALFKESADPKIEDMFSESRIFFMYLLHSLPYAQSAFNWLFYAFLNRNLRNSGGRSSHTARSTVPTSTLFENPMSSNVTPLWKNIQQMGSQLRTATADTSQLLLRRSPFRSRSRVQSRSSTYLGVDSNHLCVSLLDVADGHHHHQQRRSTLLIPRMEPSLAGLMTAQKCVSFSDLPRNGDAFSSPVRELSTGDPVLTPTNSDATTTSPLVSEQGGLTESNSVEWL
ncbi:hypothetical protein PENTCL1PPCAC_29372 [Pristionchus entomophagus]|uniref:G-protein coupled receptors family 1 profile domain-containing protein n=1 Tax=Pristionchus entomophagus TaxID=358040 RepID=A0AAV5ULL6_9BILA|nr:hypothetical protein PENTCL1PPCAC_29372 [Pristionchus entomophagus]